MSKLVFLHLVVDRKCWILATLDFKAVLEICCTRELKDSTWSKVKYNSQVSDSGAGGQGNAV